MLSTNPNFVIFSGPMLTYIASCGDDCTTFDSQLANWVKIEEVGRSAPGQPWKQQDLCEDISHLLSFC